MERPDNDEYFMEMAFLVSKRSTCLRRRVGAVIVKDKRVLSTGYNGSPKGTQHCETLGCIREQMKIPSGTRHELCRGVHAEQNAIVQAAYFGISVKDSTALMDVVSISCHLCILVFRRETDHEDHYHDHDQGQYGISVHDPMTERTLFKLTVTIKKLVSGNVDGPTPPFPMETQKGSLHADEVEQSYHCEHESEAQSD